LWWLTPAILATWEAEIRRIMVQDQLEKVALEIQIPKITREKWTAGVSQAPSCKHEALSSYPSPTNKRHSLLTKSLNDKYKFLLYAVCP
jgi:hypothetical protein